MLSCDITWSFFDHYFPYFAKVGISKKYLVCNTSGCYESQPFVIPMSEKLITQIWLGRLDRCKWQIKCQYSMVAFLSKKYNILKFYLPIQNIIPKTFYVGGDIVICICLSCKWIFIAICIRLRNICDIHLLRSVIKLYSLVV